MAIEAIAQVEFFSLVLTQNLHLSSLHGSLINGQNLDIGFLLNWRGD